MTPPDAGQGEEPPEVLRPPPAAEAEREARLSPSEAVEGMRIRLPWRANRRLRELVGRANGDLQLRAWWHVANVNAVKRMEINDHSWVHIQIVTNIALKLVRQLARRDVEPAMVTDYGLTQEDAEVVVVLGSLLHCVGMAVHRDRHEDWSLFLAEPKCRELLEGLYEEPEMTVIVSEVLQTITSHREGGRPLTLEAGIVRVADALDMAKGRSRIPFERGSASIHAVSAAAIDAVSISNGEDRPVLIEVTMTNPAGLYQVEELLKRKLRGSGLEPYVEVVANVEGETERREYRLQP
jgi:metal-dependent HD superfamily phosphatase/phosphodiesterase